MKILGIDYGTSKIGVAIAEGLLADPVEVIRVSSIDEAVNKILKTARDHIVDKIIVGISENQIADEQRKLISHLRGNGFEVEGWDETLSTKEAQRFSIQSGSGQKKRREFEDAFAAAIMVQSYIDYNNG